MLKFIDAEIDFGCLPKNLKFPSVCCQEADLTLVSAYGPSSAPKWWLYHRNLLEGITESIKKKQGEKNENQY